MRASCSSSTPPRLSHSHSHSSMDGELQASPSSPSSSEEPRSALTLTKGLSIFLDILRRADKNDDGKLSFDEFKAYFADGILSRKELHELFHAIDTHDTDNLDTEELFEYFSQHLGEYENVLSALEDLNISILKAMDTTKKSEMFHTHHCWHEPKDNVIFQYFTTKAHQLLIQFIDLCEHLQLGVLQLSFQVHFDQAADQRERVTVHHVHSDCKSRKCQRCKKQPLWGQNYQEASKLEQFVTRFLLKETLNQLQSLHNSLECAMETTEAQTRQENQGPTKPEVLTIQQPGRRLSRRLQRNNSFSPVSPVFNAGWLDEENQWVTQINRLQKLIDRLEQKDLKLTPLEEVSEGNTNAHIMIVQRQMSVIPEELEQFRHALKQYVDSASSQDGCLYISIQKFSNEACFTVYEFWENSKWNSNLQMKYSKTFQRSNVDCLKTPEHITTMLVPASWWVLSN